MADPPSGHVVDSFSVPKILRQSNSIGRQNECLFWGYMRQHGCFDLVTADRCMLYCKVPSNHIFTDFPNINLSFAGDLFFEKNKHFNFHSDLCQFNWLEIQGIYSCSSFNIAVTPNYRYTAADSQ